MKFIAVRSLPLSEDTKAAWRYAGAIFPSRGSSNDRIITLAKENRAEFILNLGSSKFAPTDSPVTVLNHGMTIYPLLWPGMTRTLLGDMMPPQPTVFPADVWIKTPGWGGRGKFHKMVNESLVLPNQWDWQAHLDGEEYRIITVGENIVQQFHRLGGNGERTYEWLSASDTPAVIRFYAKAATNRLPGLNVIAWDLIYAEGNAFLFEGNSCPGMSEVTAIRVVNKIQEILEEEGINAGT